MVKLNNRGLLMVVGGTLIVYNGCRNDLFDTENTTVEKVPDRLFFNAGQVSFIGTLDPVPFNCEQQG